MPPPLGSLPWSCRAGVTLWDHVMCPTLSDFNCTLSWPVWRCALNSRSFMKACCFLDLWKKDGNYKVARYERKRKDTAETFGIHVSTISKLSKLNKTTTELLRSFIRHFVPLFCYYMRTSIYTYVEEALLKWLNIDIHFNKATPLNVNSV